MRDIFGRFLSKFEVIVTLGTFSLIRARIVASFYRAGKFMVKEMAGNDISTLALNTAESSIESSAELGRAAREHRKSKGLTLETVSGLGNLSTRFLSEFERGKETAEVGKVLKALRILGLEVVVRPKRQGSFARANHIKLKTDRKNHD